MIMVRYNFDGQGYETWDEVNSFVQNVLEQKTSARGLLFEAYSG
jgi:hypothetical protein